MRKTNEQVIVTAKIPSSLHALFKAKAATEQLKMEEAIERALRHFLQAPKEKWA